MRVTVLVVSLDLFYLVVNVNYAVLVSMENNLKIFVILATLIV